METMLTAQDLCRVLSVSRSKLAYMRQQLPSFPAPLHFGQAVRWRRADVERWIDKQIAAQTAPPQDGHPGAADGAPGA